MKWLEYVIVALIFIVALWLAVRGRRVTARECSDCPLADSCDKKNRKKSSK